MRAWLIVNPASGSVTETDPVDMLAAAGIELAGTSIFPAEPLPSSEELTAATIGLLILFAGDGTINAAACALDGWAGRVLVLPGGTMNMLAQSLHGTHGAAEILARIGDGSDAPLTTLPFVEAGPRRAFVALIAGPPSTWAHAREAVRKGRLAAAWRAARIAWTRSFAGGVRLGGRRRDRRHRALVIVPGEHGLEVAAIDIEGWIAAMRLGITWLAGDWRSSPAVLLWQLEEATIEGGRAIHLLFDGEAAKLPAPLRVTHGMSRLRFITTLDLPAPEEGVA